MTALLSLIGGWRTIIIAVAAMAAAGYIYHLGYDSAATKWEARYEQREAQIAQTLAAEVNRISQANAMAKANEAVRLAAMEAENAALELKIKELSDAADADPDRDRVCLSDGSRLRIDSIH